MSLHYPTKPDLNQRPGNRNLWGNLHGSSQSLALISAARQHSGLTLVVTTNTADARILENELRFFGDNSAPLPILTLPDWETLPYDHFSPHQDIISERLQTLYHLPQTHKGILVVPITTLMHRLPPPDYVSANCLILHCGQKFDISAMRQQLEATGYRCVDTVYEHGEFSVRGAILDVFPMGSEIPFRIDLFDDEIDTLRTFDPETQRSIESLQQIELLPAREFPLDKSAISRFRDNWHSAFDVDHRRCPIYQDISTGISPAGIEYYLPLFFEQCSTLFDYLPQDCISFTLGNINQHAEHFWRDLNDRYENRRVDPERPLLPPTRMFVPVPALFEQLNHFPRTDINPTALEEKPGNINFASQLLPPIAITARQDNPLHQLQQFIETSPDRVLFCAESAGRRETLLELLRKIKLQPTVVSGWQAFLNSDTRLAITVAAIDRSARLSTESGSIALVTEAVLFGEQIQQRRRRQRQQEQSDQVIKNLTELHIGAPVVHIEHGVGRYRGLETITVDKETNEFLMLEYADGAKLYVPVANLDLISRYTGADESLAPLHKLGTEQWSKAKRKAAEQVRDAAAALLDIYARRAAQKGHAFSDPQEAYLRFASGFPFEETPDQLNAIEAVYRDMLSPQPMDRLVCGDVGFGKTEVAMRAAFIAVHSGKQVAMLVPTTLLAQQHYENFKDRFADMAVNVEVMSRFRSGKETDEIKRKLANGQVDIVIGTHKLLGSDLNYQALGLLIIDEEHRFGVQQKEKIKSLRAQVDILTLTATPIPRTLNMAMSGIRDLSIIATPPAKRLSVKTFVRQHDDALVKEAILREILRGGQVYYLHNEVKTIEKVASELAAMIPDARIGIGHGQMAERELEKIMTDLYHKRINILVCTTIIETGIDVPNANTIIIDRADKFGLAQLHQLRGRVGRSHHQAYAYLMTPPVKAMTPDAVKRLEAIAAANDLGAGFTLATHDLEIRGAGELLGDEQSGQMHAVGFSLYMEMLDRAVKAIKAGKTPNINEALDAGIDVNLRMPALIPEDYLPDVNSRLLMYKRIASAETREALRELQVEMIDRFGLLPQPCKNLFEIAALKLQAQQLGIVKLEAGPTGGRIEFNQQPQVDPLVLVKLIQSQPQKYRLDGAQYLKFFQDMETHESRIQSVNELLKKLAKAA